MTVFQTERLLGRMFFARFFESELLPPGLPQVQLLIWGIACVTAPGYLLSVLFAIRYGTMPHPPPAEAVLGHQLLFVLFGMIALGAVGLIFWNGIFPDKRDVRILHVLPLSTSTHVLARLGALSAVAVLVCLGVNGPSAVVYGLTLWGSDIAAGPLHGVAGHLVATSMGGLFAFFSVIAVQGSALAVLGRHRARQLALLLQVILVIGLLQAALFVPLLSARMQTAFATHDAAVAARLPPAWFLAVYNVIAGTSQPGPAGYALTGLTATLFAVMLSVTFVAGSYGRLLRLALETPQAHGLAQASGRRRLVAAVASVIVRSPVQRSVAGFTLRTFVRSRTHLTFLATYAGVTVAAVLFTLIPLMSRRGMAAFAEPTVALLSLPLVIHFVMLGGMRILVALPTEIKANWAFRLYAPEQHLAATIRGVQTAFLVAVVGPVSIATGTGGMLLWGAQTGLLIGLFTGATGALLVNVLLIGLRKIPFTCTYYPGRSRVRTMWPFYAIAFSLYAYALAALEVELLARPWLLVGLVVVIAMVSAGFAQMRRRSLRFPPGLTYAEQDPDGMFSGFGLSEGLAATEGSKDSTTPRSSHAES